LRGGVENRKAFRVRQTAWKAIRDRADEQELPGIEKLEL